MYEAGCHFPSRLWGLGERRKLPQRGLGQSPGQKGALVHLELERTHLMSTNLTFFLFLHYMFSHIHVTKHQTARKQTRYQV